MSTTKVNADVFDLTDDYIFTGDVSGAGGGKVLQVQSTLLATTTSKAGAGAFSDIVGMSIAITPAASNSKVLVTVVANYGSNGTSSNLGFRLLRDSTAICVNTDATGSRTKVSSGGSSSGANYTDCAVITFLDSPSTTSAVTYKLQWYVQNSTTSYLNREYTDGNDINNPWTASTITAMEIGA